MKHHNLNKVLLGVFISMSLIGRAQLRQSYGHVGRIESLAFSTDGKYLVSGSCDPNDHSFDSHYLIVANIKRETTEFLGAKEYNCSPLTFLPNSYTIICQGEDHTVQFWDILQGNLIKKYSGNWGDFKMVSPDGKYIACKGEGNTIKLINANTSKLSTTLPGKEVLGFSSDSKKIMTESFGRIIQLWNLQDNKLIKSLDEIEPAYSWEIAISNNLKHVAWLTNQQIQIWDVDQSKIVKVFMHTMDLKTNFPSQRAIAISSNGNLLAASSKSKIYIWDTFRAELIQQFSVSDDSYVHKILFSPDGKLLASASTTSKTEINESSYKGSGKYPGIDFLEKIHIWNLDNTNYTQNNISAQVNNSTNATHPSESVDQNIPVNNVKNLNRYALVIGNEDYQRYQSSLRSEQNVMFARNDAVIFKDYLIKTLGFPSSNVFLLTDATRGQMGREIDRLTELAKLNSNSEIVFYYAGHGFPDLNTKEGYIIPVDVTAAYLQDAISLKELYNKFSSSKASRIVVFLDACFSGGGRGENGLLEARTVRIKPKGDIVDGNIVAFTATSGEEVSLPLMRESHGLFTYYLLRKLKDTKGNVTLNELKDYLETELPKASLIENSIKQTPQVLTAPDLGDKWLNWKWR